MGCPPLSRRPEIVWPVAVEDATEGSRFVVGFDVLSAHERQRRRSGVDVVVEIDHAVFVLPFAIIGIGLHRRRGDRLAQFGQVFQRVDARLAVFDDGAVLADGDEFADYGVGRDVAALNGNDSRARTVLFAEGKRRDGDGLLVGGSAALRGDEAHQSDDVLTSIGCSSKGSGSNCLPPP